MIPAKWRTIIPILALIFLFNFEAIALLDLRGRVHPFTDSAWTPPLQTKPETSFSYGTINQYQNQEEVEPLLQEEALSYHNPVKEEGGDLLKQQFSTSKIEAKAPIDRMANVKGNVLNEKNETIVGVSVMIKGTDKGTVTDLAGDFQLQQVNASDILVF